MQFKTFSKFIITIKKSYMEFILVALKSTMPQNSE